MSIRGLLTCHIALLASAALVLAACSSAPRPAASAAPAVRADVAFTCLWWSEAQMEGLNPNAPPPKNTEVKLTKWEYSDPVGVPHPDTVDVVVTLANSGGQALSNLEVEVAVEWKDGPLRNAASAAWSKPAVLQNFQGVSVGPSGPQTLRVPVDLKAIMESLARQREWPYGLRATVTVRVPGSAQPLAQAAAELPIMPGD
jgi:hypothetical protein